MSSRGIEDHGPSSAGEPWRAAGVDSETTTLLSAHPADVRAFPQSPSGDLIDNQQLQRDILRAVECVQRRIGQDLHDVVAQELFALSLGLQRVQRHLESGSKPAPRLIEELQKGLDDAIGHVRAVAHGLTMAEVEANGLARSLAELADATRRYWTVECRYEGFEQAPEGTTSEVACQLYRIAQEAAANAARHSGAEMIIISLQEIGGTLSLVVADDGVWRPPGDGESGMGRESMRYRSGLINAEFRLETTSSGGTRVRCDVPMRQVRSRSV